MAKKTPRSAKRDTTTPESQGGTTERASRQGQQAADRSHAPNRPLLALALAGMGLAGYLTYTGWTGSQLAYCEVGDGCDIVQSSEWATFLGMPTAFWGLLTYALLAFIAVRVTRATVQWRRAWLVAIVGLGVSIYLTAISVFTLQATCPYCLASLGLFTAIVALLVWQRPAGLTPFTPRALARTGAAALVVMAAMHLHATDSIITGDEDPYLRGLAIRLTETGTEFYGASWCPHCQRQKAMFGASEDRLPYIECSPGGRTAPLARSCLAARVQSFPTWIFPNGERVNDVLSVQELADRVGYAGPAETAATP